MFFYASHRQSDLMYRFLLMCSMEGLIDLQQGAGRGGEGMAFLTGERNQLVLAESKETI